MRSGFRACGIALAVGTALLLPTTAQASQGPASTRSWVQVATGLNHTCGILDDGTLWCWGDNSAGALGTGDNRSHLTPAQVGTDTNWSSVTTNGFHTCAIKTDTTLWCWGDNNWGEVGDGTSGNIRTVPVQVGIAGWAGVSLGRLHTCAVRIDGTLWCWGINDSGQLGLGDGTARDVPTQVGGATTWTATSAGNDTSCATRDDGTAWCWGSNAFGQLGDGGSQFSEVPEQVGTDTDWAHVDVNGFSTCGTKNDSTLWCWGSNSRGLLGQGRHPAHPLIPGQVGAGTDWAQAGVGWAHTCATKTTGSLWCWGWNKYGQLGNDGAENGRHSKQYTPTRIGHATWVVVSSGDDRSCAIRTNGTAWCWGHNEFGELGNGTRADAAVPTQVPTP